MVTHWTQQAICLEAGFQCKEGVLNTANKSGVTTSTHTYTGFKLKSNQFVLPQYQFIQSKIITSFFFLVFPQI